MSTPPKPQRAIILARISDAREKGEERDPTDKGVKGQVADGRKLAKRLGWKVGPEASHVIVEILRCLSTTPDQRGSRRKIPD
jgi:hypothetical protein